MQELPRHQRRALPVDSVADHRVADGGQVEPALKLVYGGEDYWYVRTLPLKGYGAVMARHIRGLQSDGKKPILARFRDRIYIYATGVTPIGTGKK